MTTGFGRYSASGDPPMWSLAQAKRHLVLRGNCGSRTVSRLRHSRVSGGDPVSTVAAYEWRQ
jgi:hypothetical protein